MESTIACALQDEGRERMCRERAAGGAACAALAAAPTRLAHTARSGPQHHRSPHPAGLARRRRSSSSLAAPLWGPALLPPCQADARTHHLDLAAGQRVSDDAEARDLRGGTGGGVDRHQRHHGLGGHLHACSGAPAGSRGGGQAAGRVSCAGRGGAERPACQRAVHGACEGPPASCCGRGPGPKCIAARSCGAPSLPPTLIVVDGASVGGHNAHAFGAVVAGAATCDKEGGGCNGSCG